MVLDRLLADPLFGERIDRRRIGAAGLSLGGYSVIAVAGGRFGQHTYDEFCSSAERDFTCEPQAEFPEAQELFRRLKATVPPTVRRVRASPAMAYAVAMLGKPDLGRLLDYTEWANHRLVRASAALSVADFKRDLGSSHGGVRGTLAHMLGAEWIWLERWKGISPPRLPDEGEFVDILALRERWQAIEEHRRSWFKNLSPSATRRKVRYKSTEGKPYEVPLWQLVQHVVNHGTYHRGQVITMLRLLGAQPVSTDLVFWDRERAAAKRGTT